MATWNRLQDLEEWAFLIDAHKHHNEAWVFLVMNRLPPIVIELSETVYVHSLCSDERRKLTLCV